MKLLLAVLFFLSSSCALSDCNDESNNYIKNANCGFDTDTLLWSYGADMTEHNDDDFLNQGVGHGSVLLHAYTFETSYYTDMNQCVNITADVTEKTVGGWVKQQFGAVDSQCRISASFYEGSSCNGDSMTCFGTFSTINTIDWTHLTCESTSPMFAPLSTNVWIDCNSPNDFSTNFDNIYVVPTGDSLFKNGFETVVDI